MFCRCCLLFVFGFDVMLCCDWLCKVDVCFCVAMLLVIGA